MSISSVVACEADTIKHVRKYLHKLISMKLETKSVTKINAQLPHGVAENSRKGQKRSPFIEYL